MIRSQLTAALALLVGLATLGFAEESAGDKQEAKEGLTLKAMLTYGQYGPPRPAKVVVGDVAHATQTIQRLAHDERGMVDFSIRFSVVNEKGVTVNSAPWRRLNIKWPASSYHHDVYGNIPRNLPAAEAGKYVMRIEVEDHLASAKKASELPFDVVVPSGIAITRLRGGHDAQGQGSAGTVFAVGGLFYVHAVVSHFGVVEGHSDFRGTLKVLETSGEPTDWPEVVVQMHPEVSAYDESPSCGIYFQCPVLRAGKFIARLHVEDLAGGTSSTEYLPILVTDVPDWTLEELRTAEEAASTSKR